MKITELIESLKAMPEYMEGYNSEGELVVINTIWAANALERSLRNCDVGTVEDQLKRFRAFCLSRKCNECPFVRSSYRRECGIRWSQMPYEEGGAK